MEKLLDENETDSLSCEICLEQYSNNKRAIIFKCGHTVCEHCSKNIIERGRWCNRCRMEINEENKNHWENKIINNIIDFCFFLNINVDCFLSFPLNFKYCEECNIFISNYSFNIHKKLNHKQICFNSKLKSFFEKNKISNNNIIITDKSKYMIYFIYYYQNDFLHKTKYFEAKKNLLLKNGKYKFYGQFISQSEQLFFNNLIRENKGPIEIKWHKGLFFSKNNKIIIHGYFGFKLTKDNNKEIDFIRNIFGLLSFNNIQFFGFFNLIGNIDDQLNMHNFAFKCGLLYNRNMEKYYFGEFLRQNIDNNLEDIFEKDLVKGEIFTIKGEGIEIKRIPNIEIVKKNEEGQRNQEKQVIQENLGIQGQVNQIVQVNQESQAIQENQGGQGNERNGQIIQSGTDVIRVTPKLNCNKNINEDSYLLLNYEFYLFKYNICFFMEPDNDNSMIIFNIDDKNNKALNIKEGFIFEFHDKSLLEPLKKYKKKDLDIKDNIIKDIEDLLNNLIQKCSIKYYNFEFKNGIIINKQEKNYEVIYETDNRTRRRNIKLIYINKAKETVSIKDVLQCLFIKREYSTITCCLMV